jgi:hypothetical protein
LVLCASLSFSMAFFFLRKDNKCGRFGSLALDCTAYYLFFWINHATNQGIEQYKIKLKCQEGTTEPTNETTRPLVYVETKCMSNNDKDRVLKQRAAPGLQVRVQIQRRSCWPAGSWNATIQKDRVASTYDPVHHRSIIIRPTIHIKPRKLNKY